MLRINVSISQSLLVQACIADMASAGIRSETICLFAENAPLARPDIAMRTALSTHMMHCTHLGPTASHLRPYRARHTTSIGLLGAEKCKLSQRRQRQCKRAKLSHVQTHASADVFALDFDGVLVDSEPEV